MTSQAELTRILDTAKFDIFLHPGEGIFLGSILCCMDVNWNSKIPTAMTNGLTVEINSQWFANLPEKTRATVLMHELRHVGYLHPLRMKGKNPKKFNYAADFAINLQLDEEGYSFEGTSPLLDRQYRGMAAEEIYDLLPDPDPNGMPIAGQQGCWSNDPDDTDLEPLEEDVDEEQIVQIVHSAVIAQQRSGHSSKEVDGIYDMIKKRNQPVVNWKAELQDFAQDKAKAGLNYARRNRRYNHVILPARGKRGRLMEMDFIFDVSGSVTDGMVEQMLAEVAYIQGVLQPKALNLVQFDTSIRKVQTFREGSSLDEIEIHGRGGTSLECVAERLRKTKPAGAVIMTDLDCPPMNHVDGVPILWLCINNPRATVNQGKLIHIQVDY